MKKINSFIGLLSLGLSFGTQAGTMGPPPADKWMNVVTLSGGPIWAHDAKLQSIYFSPELSRYYTVNNSNQVLGQGELFLGKQRIISEGYQGKVQLGLALAAASNVKVSGNVWDFEDPRFENYIYKYKVQPSRIAVKGKLIANNENYQTKPWISASIGLGYLKSKQYQEIPIICEAVSLPTVFFKDYRTKSFSYSFGAGLHRILSPNWQVGLGYEFTDWGKSRLDGALAQPVGSFGLVYNRLRTQGLLFNLTWLS